MLKHRSNIFLVAGQSNTDEKDTFTLVFFTISILFHKAGILIDIDKNRQKLNIKLFNYCAGVQN